jgi:hypothetical protein
MRVINASIALAIRCNFTPREQHVHMYAARDSGHICLQQHANIWRENGEDVNECERLPEVHRHRFRRIEAQDELGEEKVTKAFLYVH